MKVTKHYEQDHVMLYVEEGDLRTCITLDNDNQMRRLGQSNHGVSPHNQTTKIK